MHILLSRNYEFAGKSKDDHPGNHIRQAGKPNLTFLSVFIPVWFWFSEPSKSQNEKIAIF